VPSQFLNDIIKAWASCRPNDTIQVSKQVLWNHSDICKSNGKPFYFDNWYQKGIQFLEHIWVILQEFPNSIKKIFHRQPMRITYFL